MSTQIDFGQDYARFVIADFLEWLQGKGGVEGRKGVYHLTRHVPGGTPDTETPDDQENLDLVEAFLTEMDSVPE
jgi:hypothetical protein